MKKIIVLFMLISLNGINAANLEEYFQNLQTDYKDGVFIDVNTVCLVGSNGSFLLSADRGNNWTKYDCGIKSNLNSVSFNHSDNMLYSVGDNSTFIKSVDFGKTWESISLPTKYHLFSIDFYNNYGIIVGDSGLVMISDNYGSTWIKKSISSNKLLKKIKFLESGRAIILDIDAGIYISDNLYDNFKKENNNGEITNGFGGLIRSKGNYVVISASTGFLISEDEGNNWKFYYRSGFLTPWFDIIEIGRLRYLTSWDPEKDYIYFNMNEAIIDSNGMISERTEVNIDKGFRMFGALFRSYIINEYSDSKDAIVCGTSNSIAISNDYQKNWSTISYINLNTSDPLINFISSDKGFVAGPKMEVFATKNSGETWSIPTYPDKVIVHQMAGAIFFEDSLNGYVYFYNKVLATKDGGLTYDSIFNPHLSDQQLSLYNKDIYNYIVNKGIFPNIQSFIVSGDLSKDLSVIMPLDSCALRSNGYINKNMLFVAGFKYDTINMKPVFHTVKHPILYLYGDKLNLIKNINLPKNLSQIYKPYFFNDSIIFLNGFEINANTITYQSYKSEDLGKSWREINILGRCWDIKSLKTGQLLALTDTGDVFVSYDTGDNWSIFAFNDNNIDIRQLIVADSQLYIWGPGLLYRANQNFFNLITSINSFETESGPPPFWVDYPYPNPAKDVIKLNMTISKSINQNKIEIELFDIMGHKVRGSDDFMITGSMDNEIVISTDLYNCFDGVYFIKCTFKDFTITKSIFIIN